MNSDIILKCRTDHFIHNKEIFKIFQKSCIESKIMIPDQGTYEKIEYRASDLCQVATIKTMKNFWNKMPLFDGSMYIDPGVYLTKNYIVRAKQDHGTWKNVLTKYFNLKSYELVFQIEWEKLNKFKNYQDNFFRSYKERPYLD